MNLIQFLDTIASRSETEAQLLRVASATLAKQQKHQDLLAARVKELETQLAKPEKDDAE